MAARAQRLPSLNAIKVFWAAARHGSFVKAAGINGVDWRKGLHFDQTALAIEAATGGLGVALAPAVLAAADLAGGRLVRLDGAELSEPFAYYLVYPADRGECAAVKAFRTWLLAELNQPADGTARSQSGHSFAFIDGSR